MSQNKDCILWTGSIQSKGYGDLFIDGKHHLAHRVAYKMANPSEDINGMFILHRCDVRRCINPEHLFPGTAQQNTDDMMAKGRWNPPSRRKRGPGSGIRKMTYELAEAIRKDYRPGQYGFGCERLGAKYGVSDTTIFNIVKGKIWTEEQKSKQRRNSMATATVKWLRASHLPE
jgi:hypothetical protein